jgi:hypothetical protein
LLVKKKHKIAVQTRVKLIRNFRRENNNEVKKAIKMKICEFWGLKLKFAITANMVKKTKKRSRVKKETAADRAKIGIGFTSSVDNLE